jgi:hypothetical protein
MIIYTGPVEDAHELIQFFRREVGKLKALRKLVVNSEKTVVLDVNKDDGVSRHGRGLRKATAELQLWELNAAGKLLGREPLRGGRKNSENGQPRTWDITIVCR